MKIIAFSAKKQGGKTTAVDDLQQRFGLDWWPINFADHLKKKVCDLFVPDDWGWDVEDLDRNKAKKLPCGLTVRETLQWFGTDVCRHKWEDVWTNCYRRDIRVYGGHSDGILTADVRFPNEVKCVQEMGGHVIRLLRAPCPEDEHESETALDFAERDTIDNYTRCDGHRIRFDAIIDNRSMTIPEQNEAVWKLVTERNWI